MKKWNGRDKLRSYGCLLAGAALVWGCSKAEDPDDVGANGDGDGDRNGAGTGGSGINGGGIDIPAAGGSPAGDGDGDVNDPVCESASREAELSPVLLAFAFDVSGSMGQYDQPHWWHDMSAKWTPVREAAQAFVEDPNSVGISASLTFFPSTSGDKCVIPTYLTPQVAMTELPTTQFTSQFDAFETAGKWGSGTPTLAAVEGVTDYLQGFQAGNPDAKFAVVLVTDGLPQGCDSQNDINLVASAVSANYASTGIPTYVIGMNNPTVPPTTLPSGWSRWLDDDGDDCGNGTVTGGSDENTCAPPQALSGLHAVAQAGGTTEAFLIDTDDPAATKAAFLSAIDAIRTDAISCDIGIPPHPKGGTFDADKIDVSYTLKDGTTTRFDYDEECIAEGAWHYDDPANPSIIQLCESTCTFAQSQPGIMLNVDFLCVERPVVVR